MLKRIHGRWLPVLIAAVFAVSCPAHAEYPDKPLRLIVPFPPGGGTDILVRAIGPKLTESWGQPVVVDMQTALPHVKSGRLRALAVTSPTRFPAVAELPTVAEAGVPGYEMTNWYGLLVPGGTPKDIIAKINAEVVRILNSPAIRERLASEGAIVVGSTPEQFAAFLRQEMAKFAKIVKASGMTATD